MINSKLDVLVLGVLAALALALLGAYALANPARPIPAELYGLTGTIIGVLGGRVMPSLATSAPPAAAAADQAAAVTVATPDAETAA